MRHLFLALVFAMLVPANGAFASCTEEELSAAIGDAQWCKDQCDGSSGRQNQCDGLGKMRQCTANAIRDGFTGCHTGQRKENDRFNGCYGERQDELLKRIRPIMGCATESPPVTPPPTIKNIEFNQRMVPANDDKQALVAAFTLPGVGDYRSITVSFERNGKKVSDISTYAVNFYDDAGRKELHVKITAYDRTVKNVADYRYFVAGTLSVLGPP